MQKISTILVLILACLNQISLLIEASNSFPYPYDKSKIDNRKIHILAESISEDKGYQTIEEFVDFDAGKETHIIRDVKDTNSNSVTHIDANFASDIFFQYKSYSCQLIEASSFDTKSNDLNQIHTVVTHKETENNSTSSKKQFHLIGVIAIWVKAYNELNGTYESRNFDYSPSQEFNMVAYTYKFDDMNLDKHYTFYFSRNFGYYDQCGMRLELILVHNMRGDKLLQTINILSIERQIADDIYETVLQLPVGYGCYFKSNQYDKLIKDNLGPLLSKSHKLELEATASKFETSSIVEQNTSNEILRSLSDTISLQLARATFRDFSGINTLQSIRHQDIYRDKKEILNYQYNVRYELDLRRGSCKMSNVRKSQTSMEEEEELSINFNNGLELKMNLEKIRQVFVELEGFHFIKRISKSPFKNLIYFEKQINSNVLGSSKFHRIVRAYSIAIPFNSFSSSSTTDQSNFNQDIKLESVTLYLFDRDKLIESYNLNIIGAETLSSEFEIAKLFDVSEECYLNNDEMRQAKDYAWFELAYHSIDSKQTQMLASRIESVQEQLYELLVNSQFGLFRIPKMELIFEDTGFVLRALMIDLPPIQIMFDSRENTGLKVNKTSNSDFEELASDLKHCVDLCKFYTCKTFSFCSITHVCIISTQQVNLESTITSNSLSNDRLTTIEGCVTYTIPQDLLILYDKSIHQYSLNRQLSKLQHQNYRDVVLPKMPDELIDVKQQNKDPFNRVDQEKLIKLTKEYVDQFYKFIEKDDTIPAQTYLVSLDGSLIVLIPNKFQLEEDPLSEFDLSDKDAGLNMNDSLQASFHNGLGMHHYKINLLLQKQDKKEVTARLFNGINYDQCALACLNSRCSSFSYCNTRQECIITDVFDIGAGLASKSLIEQDIDCFIAQRDFITKFNRFPNVMKPNIYKKSVEVYNPSECAYACIVEKNFNCLSFDYCDSESLFKSQEGENLATCYYLDTNNLMEDLNFIRRDATSSSGSGYGESFLSKETCSHYSRSYLADFSKIPYKTIKKEEFAKLKTTTIKGRSMDQCADICINDLNDCTAFEFCFDILTTDSMQTCVFIESKLTGNTSNYQVLLGDDSTQNKQFISSGKFIIDSDNCHLFSLRKDSTEAHYRDLALNSMSVEDEEKNRKNSEKETEKNRQKSHGLSIASGIVLHLSLILGSAIFAGGICFAKYRSEFVREKFERFQLLLGL